MHTILKFEVTYIHIDACIHIYLHSNITSMNMYIHTHTCMHYILHIRIGHIYWHTYIHNTYTSLQTYFLYYILHTYIFIHAIIYKCKYTNQTQKNKFHIIYILYTHTYTYTHIPYIQIQYNMYTHTHTNIMHITHAYIPTFIYHTSHMRIYLHPWICIYIYTLHPFIHAY